MVAGTARDSAGVVVGILVEGDVESRVRVAEDVATLAAVMPPCPVVEMAHARRLVADGRISIELPVFAGRSSGGLGEPIKAELVVVIVRQAFAAVVGLPPCDLAKGSEAAEGEEATVVGGSRRATLVVGLALGALGGVLIGP